MRRGPGRRNGGAAPLEWPSLTQKKQRTTRPVDPSASPRSGGASGRIAAGREAFPAPTARRRSETALAGMGLETALDEAARLERTGQATAARALRRWVNMDPGAVLELLRSLPATRGGGHGRELRVGMCGVAFVAWEAGAVVHARRACKDRLCPSCGERRRRRFSARLREIVREERERGRDMHLLFVTFTQPKRWMECPQAALRRLLVAFRRFREGPWGRRYLRGGVRSMEVTARRRGAKVGDYEVTIAGVHAHLHCLLDVDPAGHSTLAGAWARACEGASCGAVDIQDVTDDNVYQVGSYVLDMSGLLDMMQAPDGQGLEHTHAAYVRAVLAALHGARLVAAFGTWKGRDLALRECEGALVFGDRSVYALATEPPDEASPVKFADGTSITAEDALLRIRNRAARSAGPVLAPGDRRA